MAGGCHKPGREPQLHINFICLTASEKEQSRAERPRLTASPKAARIQQTKPHLALALLLLLFSLLLLLL